MKDKDVLRALELCRACIKNFKSDAKPIRANKFSVDLPYHDKVQHALWMADTAIAYAQDRRKEKALRWLGFIQGILWAAGFVSIHEAKDMNRAE